MKANEAAEWPALMTAVDVALRLHREGPDLKLLLPDGTRLVDTSESVAWKYVDGTVEFSSLEHRNRVVAGATFEGIGEAWIDEPARLFEAAHELWGHEIGSADMASGRLIALASDRADVLALATRRIRDGSDVFDVLHLLEAALPFMASLDVDAVVALVSAKHEKTQGDIGANQIFGSFQAWFQERPSSARKLHEKALLNLTDATANLLGVAVVSLAKTDYATAVAMAKADARSSAALRSAAGAWELGCLLHVPDASDELKASVVEEIRDLVRTGEGSLRLKAIEAAAGALHCMSDFDQLLEGLAKDHDQEVLCAAAGALSVRTSDLMTRGAATRWLELLTALKPEHPGCLRSFDFAMSRLLAHPEMVAPVVMALDRWVAHHGQAVAIDLGTAEFFRNTLCKLFKLGEQWSDLSTDWLLRDDGVHAASLSGVFQQLGHELPNNDCLNRERLDALSEMDFLFLARRLLGYVNDRGRVTSLAISMLKSKNPEQRVHPVLGKLLVDEIGYDYPGATIEACRNAANTTTSESDRAFLLAVADAIDRREVAIDALPRLKELVPPTRLKRLFARARVKQMGESFEESSKDAVWRQIGIQIPIKAGRSTFSFHAQDYGPTMNLSSLSTTIELPRREVFDPIGNTIRHFGFRTAKRTST